MDRSDEIKLVTETWTEDDYGVLQPTESTKTVFCDVASVTGSEIAEFGRNGINPELRFSMFRYDYSGERIVEYNGERYSVYRTYFARNDTIELYCEIRGGTYNGEPEVVPDGQV